MFETKQNPFSIYDFLGYLIPGAIFLYGLLFIAWFLNLNSSSGISLHEYIDRTISFSRAEIYIPYILLAYALGHFFSFLSSITIESYSIWTLGYPSKYLLGISQKAYLEVNKAPVKLRKAVRILVWVSLLPISILDYIFGQKLKVRELYAKGLDAYLRGAIGIKIQILINKQALIEDPSKYGSSSECDFFRYVYHYALENAPNHIPKMQNYIALYGFLRTLTFISVLFFWSFLLWYVFSSSNMYSIIFIFIISIFSYVFYMGFIKFYRRFSLEALMAMTVIINNEKGE